MNVKQYRKKPVVIEAILWDGQNWSSLESFLGADASKIERHGKRAAIVTLEGTMLADEGDYIIKGVKNEFYPCKPDIFEATYELVL